MKKSTLRKQLEKAFPGIPLFDGDYGLSCSAEDGFEIDGLPVADYYDFPYYDPQEKIQEGGINKKLVEFVRKRGFFCEWINAGCFNFVSEY